MSTMQTAMKMALMRTMPNPVCLTANDPRRPDSPIGHCLASPAKCPYPPVSMHTAGRNGAASLPLS